LAFKLPPFGFNVAVYGSVRKPYPINDEVGGAKMKPYYGKKVG